MRRSWEYGYAIANEIRKLEIRVPAETDAPKNPKSDIKNSKINQITPITGDMLGFDAEGQRKGAVYNIYRSFMGHWKKYGIYTSQGLKITSNRNDFNENATKNKTRLTLTVTTVLDAPYVMVKPMNDRTGLDDKFEGYCIDLLNKLAAMNKFDYNVYLVDDGNYGSPQKDGTWNGMIGDLISNNADIAIAPLTITYERSKVVDFTKPFMRLGVSILYRKPLKEDPGPFSFMEPLSPEVWCSIGISYIIVVIALFVFSRLTPYEWTHFTSQPQTTPIQDAVYVIEDPHADENNFDCGIDNQIQNSESENENNHLKLNTQSSVRSRKRTEGWRSSITENRPESHSHGHNHDNDDFNENNYYVSNIGIRDSFWFGIGGLMQQGSEINPRAVSTRILASFWWCFSLIITMYYTANLAAFLTVERMDSPINSADDLAQQTRIKYGTLKNGATEAFFQSSKIDTYKRMWNTMLGDKSVWAMTTREGIDRVKNSTDYAFLMESTTLQYEVARDCNITQIGGDLDSKGFGIAVGKSQNILQNEPQLRDKLSMSILLMKQNGELEKLKEKWWKGSDCPKEEMRQNSLGLKAIGGVFVFLAFGVLISLVTALCEFFAYTCIKAAKNETSWKTQITSNAKRSTSWNHRDDFKRVWEKAKNTQKRWIDFKDYRAETLRRTFGTNTNAVGTSGRKMRLNAARDDQDNQSTGCSTVVSYSNSSHVSKLINRKPTTASKVRNKHNANNNGEIIGTSSKNHIIISNDEDFPAPPSDSFRSSNSMSSSRNEEPDATNSQETEDHKKLMKKFANSHGLVINHGITPSTTKSGFLATNDEGLSSSDGHTRSQQSQSSRMTKTNKNKHKNYSSPENQNLLQSSSEQRKKNRHTSKNYNDNNHYQPTTEAPSTLHTDDFTTSDRDTTDVTPSIKVPDFLQSLRTTVCTNNSSNRNSNNNNANNNNNEIRKFSGSRNDGFEGIVLRPETKKAKNGLESDLDRIMATNHQSSKMNRNKGRDKRNKKRGNFNDGRNTQV